MNEREALKRLIDHTSGICETAYGPDVEAAFDDARKALAQAEVDEMVFIPKADFDLALTKANLELIQKVDKLVDHMQRQAVVKDHLTPRRPLLFSKRLAIADKLGIDLNTVTAVVREVEAQHEIEWATS